MNTSDSISDQQIIDTDKLLTPLSGDNPAGIACNYEAEYEAAEAELSKLSSIELEEVNWELVSTNCQKLLEEKTKDLQLSCFLAVSLFKTHGYNGLNEGLQLVDQLQNSFWHDLFPPIKRMRGRAAAINWLTTQLIKALAEKEPLLADAENIEDIYTVLESISEFTTQYIDQNTPNLSELLRLANGYRSKLQSANATTEATNSEKTEPIAETPIVNSPQQNIGTQQSSQSQVSSSAPSDLSEMKQSSRKSLKMIAESMRSTRLSDAEHFYINRIAVWLPVTDLPINDQGKTQLQAPNEQVISTLKSQLDSGNNEQVIVSVEEILGSSPFWFEGNKISVLAMEDLGKKFHSARTTIISSTYAFLQRFPALSGLTFADGTDFVSENFKQWLDGEAGVAAASSNVNSLSVAHDLINPEIVSEARKFASKAKLAEALQLLDGELKMATSGKQKFSLRILQAELCNSSERYDMATPILELLDLEQQRREMSSWEPELSIQVLQSLLNCYTKVIQKKPNNINDLKQRADSVFDRLCQLEPTAAFKFKL